ncbi:hypothetical protein C8R45DRAFT_119683 [Mycena sanguinolenta]|nr:hypothetical protein C8R45DRAFT_119683 [Mycena sanguinolenta]
MGKALRPRNAVVDGNGGTDGARTSSARGLPLLHLPLRHYGRTPSAMRSARRGRRCAGSPLRSLNHRIHPRSRRSRASLAWARPRRRTRAAYPPRSCTSLHPHPHPHPTLNLSNKPRTRSRISKQRTTRRPPIWTGWRTRGWRRGRWAGRSRNLAQVDGARIRGAQGCRIRLWETPPPTRKEQIQVETKREIALQRDVVHVCLPTSHHHVLPFAFLPHSSFPHSSSPLSGGGGGVRDSGIDVDFGPFTRCQRR